MRRTLINWLGITGVVALVSYAVAVVISPTAYPAYDWMSQAVSDLSAQSAPSRMLWDQLATPYGVCSVVCATCSSIFVSERRVASRGFRLGVYLFAIMRWVSYVGYGMFPLSEAGTGQQGLQNIMHVYVVTTAVVLLSIASLVLLIVAGCRGRGVRGMGAFAAVALAMMLVGAIGQGVVPPAYFGVVERFSVFAAVGFDAVLGIYLFRGFA
ncbi:MAG: DUF998 domain-containing protein [Coriobacteriales bacterium]|nr:DUF998 domain-containing protein [Coriobacteriales bacterium]